MELFCGVIAQNESEPGDKAMCVIYIVELSAYEVFIMLILWFQNCHHVRTKTSTEGAGFGFEQSLLE